MLHEAVRIARTAPVRVQAGDLTTDLPAVAAAAPADATLVVFHSAVLSYLDAAQRAAFRREIAELAATRPTVWISNEGPRVVVDVPIPPGPVPFVLALGDTPLAYADPHGGSVEWLR